jgi:hypothetical protein
VYSAAEREGFGLFLENRSVAIIYEKAFTPSLREIFLSRAELGGALHFQNPLARYRFILDNGLRGNLAFRTTVHEAWHYLQYMDNPGGYQSLVGLGNTPVNPLEWTQRVGANPRWLLPGAYNMESVTPYGLWVQSLLSLQLLTGSRSTSSDPNESPEALRFASTSRNTGCRLASATNASSGAAASTSK